MKKPLIAALALTASMAAVAKPIEIDARCGQRVADFFAPLIQQDLIKRKPYSVSPGNVNLFDVRLFKPLTAFGLPVTTVMGYTDDPLLFTARTASEQDVYGVMVREGIGNVQAHLNSIGVTDARVIRADAKTTVILCKGVM